MGRNPNEVMESLESNFDTNDFVEPPNFNESRERSGKVHVEVPEDQIGQFFKTVREFGFETNTFRRNTQNELLVGWVWDE